MPTSQVSKVASGHKRGGLCRLTRCTQWVFAVALLSVTLPGHAQSDELTSWVFSDSIAVSNLARSKVFYHLESSGRKNIAASTKSVAIVWEDNRTGSSAIYLASKAFDNKKFEAPVLVSAGNEAIEPSITALSNDRYLMAWEQDGRIWSRVFKAGKLGMPSKIEGGPGVQVSVTSTDKGQAAYAVWSQRAGAGQHIRLVRLSVVGPSLDLVIGEAKAIDHANNEKKRQFYPSIAIGGADIVVAWEDRRAGHTQIFYSCAEKNKAFSRPQVLNEQSPRISTQYGSGTGAARVSLSRVADGDIIAVWSDKRDFRSGYDVYSSFIRGSACRLDPNSKVQDEFGASIAQWHPSVVGDTGLVAAVWEDDRNESADIWLSWIKKDGSWSDDLGVSPASGEGDQSHPAMTIDHRGRLHLVWLDRPNPSAASQLRYAEAEAKH
ncbi:MAG: hypothetical protein GXP09_08565 [Gammaproteobacteria bacterium]|nr:hypothetical protein [Gammaproteobacteria bacterium]